MKTDISSIEGKKVGTIDLSDNIYGLKPRSDILHRVVKWQLSRKRQGSRKIKTRSEITGSTKKIVRQKGSGSARHGDIKSNIFRGGTKAHGPVVRNHEIKLLKKVRKLGLKHALSAKKNENAILVIQEPTSKDYKTGNVKKVLLGQGVDSGLLVYGAEINKNFRNALSNISSINLIPSRGANVYDILKCRKLILTEDAVKKIEERLL
jgi:large subunit ribosomal protein L4